MANLYERLESELGEKGRTGMPGTTEPEDLSDELFDILSIIVERGEMSLTAIVDELSVGLSRARVLLDTLVEKGHVVAREIEGGLRYRASSVRNNLHEAPVDIWDILGNKVE